jgi:hypothetical protein
LFFRGLISEKLEKSSEIKQIEQNYLSDSVVEFCHCIILNPEEALGCPLLGDFVLEIPDSIPVRELVVSRSAFRQNSALEAGHREEEVGVVL